MNALPGFKRRPPPPLSLSLLLDLLPGRRHRASVVSGSEQQHLELQEGLVSAPTPASASASLKKVVVEEEEGAWSVPVGPQRRRRRGSPPLAPKKKPDVSTRSWKWLLNRSQLPAAAKPPPPQPEPLPLRLPP